MLGWFLAKCLMPVCGWQRYSTLFAVNFCIKHAAEMVKIRQHAGHPRVSALSAYTSGLAGSMCVTSLIKPRPLATAEPCC